MPVPSLTVQKNRDSHTFLLRGSYDVSHWYPLQDKLRQVDVDHSSIILDFTYIEEIDTFGAWHLCVFIDELKKRGCDVTFAALSPETHKLIKQIQSLALPPEVLDCLNKKTRSNLITAIGHKTLFYLGQSKRMISFLGDVVVAFGRCFLNYKHFRVHTFLDLVDQVGFKSLPIIGLIAFLIGVVLVYQGVSQLERFGAQIFTVNLLAISVLRELGILLTSIVIAGRSGSAFTAQIGFMKLNQEIDAMIVMGLSPMQLLVIPRILALILCLPLLTIFCNLIALTGGAVMSASLIHLSYDQYLLQLQNGISSWTFWTGLIKAPVFALIIGFVSCYEGLRVSGGAADVGRRTTQSVVKSIFLVLILDAVFSVIYSYLGI